MSLADLYFVAVLGPPLPAKPALLKGEIVKREAVTPSNTLGGCHRNLGGKS